MTMIYEMRTYDLKPRTLAEVMKRFGEAYEKRRKFSELYAFWYTEIGPLNQIIHVWPYENLEERARIRAAAVKDGGWPPRTGEFIARMRSDIMMPWGDLPAVEPGKVGPYFEMRSYCFNPGDLPKIQASWAQALPNRLKLSPLLALWYSELGELNRFVHIWPYRSLDQRMALRQQAIASGGWPPTLGQGDAAYNLITQETKILLAAPFSPLQ
ncbi:MAG: NIPSNAP family protein [Betaproteobacteria bacterium]|nr:NIPSNAP family protein [Betaproteobacteria bacterium]